VTVGTKYPQCLSMGCFSRGQGLANVGGNCAIWNNVSDAQACQQYCQDIGTCKLLAITCTALLPRLCATRISL
jgi:hypothetical protein